jgi:uncharacterized protein RhaS with RHS repeats
MNGRVYDPAAGRFLSVDPIVHVGLSQSPNGYAYVWNNPLTLIDPSGFDPGEYGKRSKKQCIEGQCGQTGSGSSAFYEAMDYLSTMGHMKPDRPRAMPDLSPSSAGAAASNPTWDGRSFGGEKIIYGVQIEASGKPGVSAADMAHYTLNAASLALDASGVGAALSWIPDFLDAGVSLLEGDWTGAAMSAGAAIPYAGAASNVAKIGRTASRAGAKSAEQLVKHLDKLHQARKEVDQLRRKLDTLKGPKAQNPVRDQIQDLLDQIRGHEKEIRQKWPELGGGF